MPSKFVNKITGLFNKTRRGCRRALDAPKDAKSYAMLVAGVAAFMIDWTPLPAGETFLAFCIAGTVRRGNMLRGKRMESITNDFWLAHDGSVSEDDIKQALFTFATAAIKLGSFGPKRLYKTAEIIDVRQINPGQIFSGVEEFLELALKGDMKALIEHEMRQQPSIRSGISHEDGRQIGYEIVLAR